MNCFILWMMICVDTIASHDVIMISRQLLTPPSLPSLLPPRSQEPVLRILALSENCIIERDPATYAIVTLRPLCDVSTHQSGGSLIQSHD